MVVESSQREARNGLLPRFDGGYFGVDEARRHQDRLRQELAMPTALDTMAENKRLTPVRRANIRLLTAADGASARLAEVMGITSGPIASVRRESSKAIGVDFCRGIEAALGLESGWLDVPHVEGEVPREVVNTLARSARGSRRSRRVIVTDTQPSSRETRSSAASLSDMADREEFEEWAAVQIPPHKLDRAPDHPDVYNWASAENAWQAWRASRVAMRRKVRGLLDEADALAKRLREVANA